MSVAALKATLDAATDAYNAERDRLAACGLNSKARYEALKPLKAAQDAANSAYVAAAKRKVHAGLTAIINQGSTDSKEVQRARRAVFMYTK